MEKSEDLTYSQLKQNLSIRYHVSMIGAILKSRFTTWCNINWKFLVGVCAGFSGAMVLFLVLPIMMDMSTNTVAPSYPTPVETTIPAQPEVELVDTDMSVNGNTFNFTGRTISDNAVVNQFECSSNGGTFTTCRSPIVLEELPSTFEVRAILANGTSDPTPAAWIKGE